MRTRWIWTATLVGALAFTPALTFAQSSTPATADKAPADKPAETRGDKAGKAAARGDRSDNVNGKLASGDRKFVMESLKHGMAEVELGKLASEKASNDAVKQFGQRMVDDHGKSGEELKKIAQDKGVTPPAEMDNKHRKLHDRLSKMQGAEFDRAYMDEMVKDHRNDVKEFQKQAKNAKDADVKSFASKTLPTLQDHLKQAEGLRGQVRTAGKGDAGGAASGRTDTGVKSGTKSSDTGAKK